MTSVEALALEVATPQEVLAWTYRSFARVALVSSFQVESLVLIDMLAEQGIRPSVVTLDTGRLPQETHAYMDILRRRYELDLHIEHPDAAELSALVDRHGPDLFRSSVELRERCCEVRKVLPLRRALAGFDAWITGLRRDQGRSRGETPVAAPDEERGMVKVAPLATWNRDRVWQYVEDRMLEVHPLYGQGFTSIGCAPCTRATAPDEPERAGRWWWEQEGAVKECGIHRSPISGRRN